MARPLRVQFSDALYHVTARSNERKPIFHDERDRPARARKLPQPVPVCRQAGTQRVAISNRRLRFVGAGKLRFTYRDKPPTPPLPDNPKHDTGPVDLKHQL